MRKSVSKKGISIFFIFLVFVGITLRCAYGLSEEGPVVPVVNSGNESSDMSETELKTDALEKVDDVKEILLYGYLPGDYSDISDGFTLNLYSDGRLELNECCHEIRSVFSGTWICRDNTLKLKVTGNIALAETIRITGRSLIFEYSGVALRQELDAEKLSFLGITIGETAVEETVMSRTKSPVEQGLGVSEDGEMMQTSDNSVSATVYDCGIQVSQIDASSWISPKKDPNAYIPTRLADGNEQTSWQFSLKKSKLKETYVYFYLEFPQDIDELWIKNGFWKVTNGLDQYTRNSRVKDLGIAFQYDGNQEWTDKTTYTLKDDKNRQDWQKISLGKHKNVTGIRFRIMSIYKGTKFPKDVCISEVRLMNNQD